MRLTPERLEEIRDYNDQDSRAHNMKEELIAEIDELKKERDITIEALEFCKNYDRSPEPNYGEMIRGHKPGIGQRFLTPKEKVRITLETLQEIREILSMGECSEYCSFSKELIAEIDELKKERDITIEALEFCKDYDRSPEPNYGEMIRGHKPGIGQRFLTPKEKVRITLETLQEIREVK